MGDWLCSPCLSCLAARRHQSQDRPQYGSRSSTVQREVPKGGSTNVTLETQAYPSAFNSGTQTRNNQTNNKLLMVRNMAIPEYNPDDPLSTTLSDYFQGRLESRRDEINWYLVGRGIDWAQITKDATHFAQVLIDGVANFGWFENLDRLNKVVQECPEELCQQSEEARLCEIEAVSQLLAERAIKALAIAEKRFWNLLRHVSITRTTSARSREFLKRVSLCYLFGFDTECIVMCRSVLDAAFEAEISTDDCIYVLGWTDKRSTNQQGQPLYTLSERLRVAEKTERIDNTTQKLAKEIIKHGNRAVHRDTTPIIDSLNIIADALKVIDTLNTRDNL